MVQVRVSACLCCCCVVLVFDCVYPSTRQHHPAVAVRRDKHEGRGALLLRWPRVSCVAGLLAADQLALPVSHLLARCRPLPTHTTNTHKKQTPGPLTTSLAAAAPASTRRTTPTTATLAASTRQALASTRWTRSRTGHHPCTKRSVAVRGAVVLACWSTASACVPNIWV